MATTAALTDEHADPAPVRGRPWARRWNTLVCVTASLGVAALGWSHRALSDDGLIFLRTARQILAGHGPVVNVGERTEADTSTLWQWLLSAAGWITPVDLGFTAVVMGLALTTGGVAIALDATRRLYGGAGRGRPTGRYLLPAGVLVLFAVPPFWDYATTGLDTGLGTFWLACCWWLLVHARGPRGCVAAGAPSPRGAREAGRLAGTAAWFGLGPLVRPDLAIASVVFLAALHVLARPGRRTAVVRLVAAGTPALAYEVFRAGYYGLLVPLPAVAKDAGASDPGRGLRYVADFADPYLLPVPVVLGLLVFAVPAAHRAGTAHRADLVVPAAPLAAALLMASYVVWVGGDFMHARMMLPPMFLTLMPILLVPAERWLAPLSLAFAMYAIVVTGPWHPGAYRLPANDTTALIRDNDIALTGVHNADHSTDWTRNIEGIPEAVRAALAGPEPVLLFFQPDQKTPFTMPLSQALRDKGIRLSVQGGYLGVTGYLVPLDQRIVERWGLSNTVAAHLAPVDDWRDRPPGHRKDLGYTWMIAMDAAPDAPLPPWLSAELDPRAVGAARHALSCGALKELLDSTRQPMSFKRFWRNLIGAPARTSLVIPRDPFAAERKFCGTRS